MKSMRIGLCGSQGSGKTTLGKVLSTELGIEFLPTSVGEFIKSQIGDVNPDTLSYLDRLTLHESICDYLINTFAHKDSFITDRTLVDVIGYNLSFSPLDDEIRQNPKVVEKYSLIKDKCERTLKIMYDHIIVTTPLNKFKSDDRTTYRAPTDLIAIEKMNSIVLGLCHIIPQSFIVIPTHCQTIKDRLNYCKMILSDN